MSEKPFGIKNYGHIPHLPNSRIGPGDHKCADGQAFIATIKPRDKHDEIIVTEKIDGSNVGVGIKYGDLIPLTRAGYRAASSNYKQHWLFETFVAKNKNRFQAVLREGERIIGEWCIQAHGTRYYFATEPFFVFDIMRDNKRLLYDELVERVMGIFEMPKLLHRGYSISINEIMKKLGTYGFHGALDEIEGAIWKVERNKVINNKGERLKEVDFLVKYVRPNKIDGLYLKNGQELFNNFTAKI